MSKFVGIKQKIIRSVMLMIAVIFVVIFAVLLFQNITRNQRALENNKEEIIANIKAKGQILAKNNSTALRGMIADNSFTAIKDLVAATVNGDSSIVRGICMNSGRIPMAYAVAGKKTDVGYDPLEDGLSQWVVSWFEANKVDVVDTAYTAGQELDSIDVFEFAAPVVDPTTDATLGYIRYTLSAEPLRSAIAQAEAEAAREIRMMILLLAILMIGAFALAYFVLSPIAVKISSPIIDLVESARVISDGNYNVEVKSQSNDEVGMLSDTFDDMRQTIKKYTEHLQELIDEKMRQVKDILNNIDQGLVTVNFDGTVGKEYSLKSNDILNVEDVADEDVYSLLRLDNAGKKRFETWVNLVKKMHTKQRWRKIEKLAPVHELEFEAAADEKDDTTKEKFVNISYQKIFDKDGGLSKLMILAKDVTEAREREMQMEKERLQHENEMKTILGVAHTPEEEILDFMKDSKTRIEALREKVKAHLDGVRKEREEYPDQDAQYRIPPEDVQSLYRDLHTLKGNGGSYGFDLFSRYAHEAEDRLEELKTPVSVRRSDTLSSLMTLIESIGKEYSLIDEKIKMINGSKDAVYVSVPAERVEYIQHLSRELWHEHKDEKIAAKLADTVQMLSWKPFASQGRKYQKAVMKAARSLKKDVEFIFADENKLVPNDIFQGVDESLIHVVRNAVAHGIENANLREEKNKGAGKIVFSVDFDDEKRIFTVSDDGAGIDREAVLAKAVEKGLVSAEDGEKMSDSDVFMFLFESGFSTAASLSDVAGRGVGLDVVRENIDKQNGTIDIKSQVNLGTTFIISLPR
ncbi:MAG: ATP-binding protein [Fibrobacterota bacterium]